MGIVLLVFLAFIVAAIAGMVYLVSRFRKFLTSGRSKEYWLKRKKLSRLVAAIPVFILLILCLFDMVNTVIVIVNTVVIWLACDGITALIVKLFGKKQGFYLTGVCAIILSAVYLGIGWYNAHNVVETDYKIVADKDTGMDNFRIVQISDSHIGATFDGDGFAEYMDEIQKKDPDIVVVTGDYVDDDTCREDMEKSSAALGRLKTTYGVYYVYGNHDRGYMNRRDFSEDDMRAELTKNNVKILQDEAVDIGDNIVLVGREDKSKRERKDMNTLFADVDKSKYIILLDHQPGDFDAEEAAGADLVLCGHTHGGQMFPVGLTGEWSGANEKTYGLEKRGNTTFIVNSGISDWAIKFKTGGAKAEYGVIDVVKE